MIRDCDIKKSTTASASILDIFASVVTRCPNGGQPIMFESSIERRVPCHRCGNIRKKKIPCVQASCPHIYCGRCAEKMKEEYGDHVFKDGCPVCLELCCCSNKSFSCSRFNHCYRKCPASKVKAGHINHEKKFLVDPPMKSSHHKSHHAAQPQVLMPYDESTKSAGFYQKVQSNVMEELYNDQTTAAVALCSLIGGNNRYFPSYDHSTPRVVSSTDASSISASDEDVKQPVRPFKKRDVMSVIDNASETLKTIENLQQGKRIRNVSPEPSRLELMNRAIEANNKAIKLEAAKNAASSNQMLPHNVMTMINPHAGLMYQQYPLVYHHQFGNPNAMMMSSNHNDDQRRSPGLDLYGGDYMPYPFAHGYSHFPGLHMTGADMAAMSQQYMMSHPAFANFSIPGSHAFQAMQQSNTASADSAQQANHQGNNKQI